MFSVLGVCLHPSLLVILVSASYFYLFFSFSGGSSLWALSGSWFGLDEVGFFLLILNKLIFLWVILSGVSESRLYPSVVFLMSNFVGGCFYLHSTIPFYAFFEASLLPMVTLVLGWGYQPERLEASKYLLVYTVFFSYPLLLSILLIELGGGGASFVEWLSSGLSQGSVVWISGLMLLGGFLVKIPVYGIHLWLPKAHVEASGGGSMILAAVLLKLGGVGLWRVFPLLNGLGGSLMGISGWSLWGGMVVSLLCLVQSDLKLLVAYSSVSHMSLVVWGILSNGVLGSHGGLIMMVAHGFASSGLFYVSGILFKESGSRSLILNQGLLIGLPGLAMAWFLVNCLSMAVPPSINFFSEIEILIFSYSVSAWGWVSVLFMAFFSVTYSMLCYTLTSHGRASSVSRGVRALTSEHQFMLFHVVASVVMILVFSGV